MAGGPGPVELRKQLTKFKSFLAKEREFWRGVLGRMIRAFGLEKGKKFIVGLGIAVAEGAEQAEAVKGGLTEEQKAEKLVLLQKVSLQQREIRKR